MTRSCTCCGGALPPGAAACPECGSAPGREEPRPPFWRTRVFRYSAILLGTGFLLCAGIFVPGLLPANMEVNERAAVRTLRALVEAQAAMRVSGRIDADGDGAGEYGTLIELTGFAGVRKGFRPAAGVGEASGGFESQGPPLHPPLVSPALANVDENGVATRSGYCFMIYLPDDSGQGFVHETYARSVPGFAGGSGRVGVDASEKRWCAYAWPVSQGNSGNRCFFADASGVVYSSANDVARHSGRSSAPPPRSVLPPGASVPGPVTTGADGDIWKIEE